MIIEKSLATTLSILRMAWRRDYDSVSTISITQVSEYGYIDDLQFIDAVVLHVKFSLIFNSLHLTRRIFIPSISSKNHIFTYLLSISPTLHIFFDYFRKEKRKKDDPAKIERFRNAYLLGDFYQSSENRSLNNISLFTVIS